MSRYLYDPEHKELYIFDNSSDAIGFSTAYQDKALWPVDVIKAYKEKRMGDDTTTVVVQDYKNPLDRFDRLESHIGQKIKEFREVVDTMIRRVVDEEHLLQKDIRDLEKKIDNLPTAISNLFSYEDRGYK